MERAPRSRKARLERRGGEDRPRRASLVVRGDTDKRGRFGPSSRRVGKACRTAGRTSALWF